MGAPSSTEEVELKLEIAAERVGALRQALRAGAVRTERHRAIYFDTPDERLARAGAALRLRREGRRWVQTLKLSTPDALRRLEHNADVDAPPGEEPALVLARHAGTPAGAALDAILGAEALDLVARFRTDVRRTTRSVRVGGARIELALDAGAVVARTGEAPVLELELELKSGPLEGLLECARRWLDAHGLWIGTVTKAERGARLARGEALRAVGARPVQAASGADAATFWLASVRSALDQGLVNLASLAGGAEDDAIVHQARVGLRRLRTALRELAAHAPGSVDAGWEHALRAAFRELGAHRDLDVVLPSVRAQLPAAGLPLFADPQPPEAPRPLVQIARDASLQRTLLDLLGLVHRAPAAVAPALAGESARSVVTRRLHALHDRLARDAGRYADLDRVRQHAVRKRLKRLRYLAEFAAPLFGAKRVAKVLGHWRAAQDALGASHDARVAAEAWRRQAQHEPAAWYAVGWLAARDAQAVDECRRALRQATKAKTFWSA